MSGKYAEWFVSEEAREAESKVIVLPVQDRTLLNGWKSSEMKEYCRLYAQLIAEDRDE